MKPFRPQIFLFRLLAAIFLWEGLLLVYSFYACSHPMLGVETRVLLSERCPRLGQRAENVFEIAIATTLSLLAGGTQLSRWNQSSSSDDPDALASPLPQRSRPLSPEESSQAQGLQQVQEGLPVAEQALYQEPPQSSQKLSNQFEL